MNRKLNYFSKVIKIALEMYFIEPYSVKLLLLFIKSNLSYEKKKKQNKIFKDFVSNFSMLYLMNYSWWRSIKHWAVPQLQSRVEGGQNIQNKYVLEQIFICITFTPFIQIQKLTSCHVDFLNILLFYISQFYTIKLQYYRDFKINV